MAPSLCFRNRAWTASDPIDVAQRYQSECRYTLQGYGFARWPCSHFDQGDRGVVPCRRGCLSSNTRVNRGDRAGLTLDWQTACAIQLAGRDILEEVKRSVVPRTIACPAIEAGKPDTLYAVAQDGIQLKVRVLVTVRTELTQIIGGAGELTIIARVGQGIVAAIGACGHYEDALADPALISRKVTERGLDSQTSFTIVSIDIADIDVGANIGARLRLDQADADIRTSLALSEARRTMAVALKQEMSALKRGNMAKLMLAEALIPRAIAAELRRPCLKIANTLIAS